MTAKEFFENEINFSGSKLPKERRRFTYFDLIKFAEAYHKSEVKKLDLHDVSVSLPSVENAGIIAVEISEINNEMTVQEQAFFIAGFQDCVKYLEKQSNER